MKLTVKVTSPLINGFKQLKERGKAISLPNKQKLLERSLRGLYRTWWFLLCLSAVLTPLAFLSDFKMVNAQELVGLLALSLAISIVFVALLIKDRNN